MMNKKILFRLVPVMFLLQACASLPIQGDIYLRQGKYDEAEKIYRELKDTEGLKKVAAAYLDREDYDKAENIYRDLKDTEGLKKVAEANLADQWYRVAENIYRELKDTEGLKKVAAAYLAAKVESYYDIEKVYSKAEKIYRELKDTEGLKKVAEAYLAAKWYRVAEKIYRELKDTEGLKKVAAAYLAEQWYRDAEKIYRELKDTEGLKKVAAAYLAAKVESYYDIENEYGKAEKIYRELKDTEGLKKVAAAYLAAKVESYYAIEKVYGKAENIYRELKDTEGLKKVAAAYLAAKVESYHDSEKVYGKAEKIYRELKDTEGLKKVAEIYLERGWYNNAAYIYQWLDDLPGLIKTVTLMYKAGKNEDAYSFSIYIMKSVYSPIPDKYTNPQVLNAAVSQLTQNEKDTLLETFKSGSPRYKFAIAFLLQDLPKLMVAAEAKAKDWDSNGPYILLGLLTDDKDLIEKRLKLALETNSYVGESDYYYWILYRGAKYIKAPSELFKKIGNISERYNPTIAIISYYEAGASTELNNLLVDLYKNNNASLIINVLSFLKYSENEIYNIMAETALAAKNYAESRDYYIKAGNPKAVTNVGDAVLENKEYDVAEQYYKAAGLSENESKRRIADYLISNDNISFAKIYLKQSGLNNDEELNKAIGDVLYNRGKYKEALAYYEKIKDPEKIMAIKYELAVAANSLVAFDEFNKAYPNNKYASAIKEKVAKINDLLNQYNTELKSAKDLFAKGNYDRSYDALQAINKKYSPMAQTTPDLSPLLADLTKISEKYYTYTTEYKIRREAELARAEITSELRRKIEMISKFTSRRDLIILFGPPAFNSVEAMIWRMNYETSVKILFSSSGVAIQSILLNDNLEAYF